MILGIGLGLGLPLIALSVISTVLLMRRMGQRRREEQIHQTMRLEGQKPGRFLPEELDPKFRVEVDGTQGLQELSGDRTFNELPVKGD
jgi:hypothetical protein